MGRSASATVEWAEAYKKNLVKSKTMDATDLFASLFYFLKFCILKKTDPPYSTCQWFKVVCLLTKKAIVKERGGGGGEPAGSLVCGV